MKGLCAPEVIEVSLVQIFINAFGMPAKNNPNKEEGSKSNVVIRGRVQYSIMKNRLLEYWVKMNSLETKTL